MTKTNYINNNSISTNNNYIELKNISLNIKWQTILKNINLSFNKNFISIFWKSWSWKSMLLNLILWAKQPIDWNIFLYWKNITNTPIIDREIWIVYQEHILFPNYNILENINLGKNIDEELKLYLIDKFWIKNILKKFPNEISWGEAQRVSIIRTLITKPKLLLLDEPFSNLDKINKDIIIKILKNILEELKIPTIVVTHDYNDIVFFWGEMILLENNTIKYNWNINKLDIKTKEKYNIK